MISMKKGMGPIQPTLDMSNFPKIGSTTQQKLSITPKSYSDVSKGTLSRKQIGDVSITVRFNTSQPQTIYYTQSAISLIITDDAIVKAINLIAVQDSNDVSVTSIKHLVVLPLKKEIFHDSSLDMSKYGGESRCIHTMDMPDFTGCDHCKIVRLLMRIRELYSVPLDTKKSDPKLTSDMKSQILVAIRLIANSFATVSIDESVKDSVKYADMQIIRNSLLRIYQSNNSSFFTIGIVNSNEICLVSKYDFKRTMDYFTSTIVNSLERYQLMGLTIIDCYTHDPKRNTGFKSIYRIPEIPNIIPECNSLRKFQMDKNYLLMLSPQCNDYGGFFPSIYARIVNADGIVLNGCIAYGKIADVLNRAIGREVFRDSKGHEGLFIILNNNEDIDFDLLITNELIALAMKEMITQINLSSTSSTDIRINWTYKHKLYVAIYNTVRIHIRGMNVDDSCKMIDSSVVNWEELLDEDDSILLDKISALRFLKLKEPNVKENN
jgi:hypothetical protein